MIVVKIYTIRFSLMLYKDCKSSLMSQVINAVACIVLFAKRSLSISWPPNRH